MAVPFKVAFRATFSPSQASTSVMAIKATEGVFTVTVTSAVFLQPLTSVPSTVYVPAFEMETVAVSSLLDHLYALAP